MEEYEKLLNLIPGEQMDPRSPLQLIQGQTMHRQDFDIRRQDKEIGPRADAKF